MPGHRDEATVWFDGASRGNPGPMAGAAVIVYRGRRRVVQTPPGRGTNNEAEYDGLLAGLRAAAEAGAGRVVVRGDSQLVLRQLEGRYQVKAPHLKPRHEAALRLLGGFAAVRLEWVPRADNAEADAAANAALDGVGPP